MARHFANVDIHGNLFVRGKVVDNLRVDDEVEAAAFYVRGVGELLPGSATDHGALVGLADDDHPQYLLVDGTRAMTGSLEIPDGDEAEPAIRFSNDLDTGLHLDAVGNFAVVVGGAVVFRFTPTAITSEQSLVVQEGTASIPGIRFDSDSNTGVYHVAADTLGISAGGAEQVVVGRDGVRVNDKVEAEAFYISSGWDLTQSMIPFDVATAEVENYWLHSFAPQSFVIEDVKLITQTGSCHVAFYIHTDGQRYPGVGVAGLEDVFASTTSSFYLATSFRTVNIGDSVLMSVPVNASATHLRGRLRVSLLR